MSDNDFREVIDGEENKEPAASDNNLHTTEAESAEVVNTTADAQESDEKKDDEYAKQPEDQEKETKRGEKAGD